jgi:hypothetical protein
MRKGTLARSVTIWILSACIALILSGCAKKEEGPAEAQYGSVQGTIKLADATDHSGILVALVGTDYSATTKSDGSFLIKDIPSGPYTIEASKEGYEKKMDTIEVSGGQTTTVTMTLQRATIVKGRVLVDGKPKAGIVVKIKDTELQAVTDEEGVFKISGVPEGDVTIVVLRDPYPAVEVPAKVEKFKENVVLDISTTVPKFPPKSDYTKTNPTPGGGDSLYAVKAPPGIKIDGKLDDWANANWIAVADRKNLFAGAGAGPWNGPDDCSYQFSLMWDEKNFYFACKVTDDVVYDSGQHEGSIWNNDCVELFFEFNMIHESGKDWTTTHKHNQLGFSAHNNWRWMWCGYDSSIQQSLPPLIENVSLKSDKGYIIEAKIPLSLFDRLSNPAFKLAPGARVGVHGAVDDSDSGSQRKLQMTWTGYEAHDQVDGFSDVILVE